MATLTKRATIYLNPNVHRILQVKALETNRSVSDLVNDALLHELMQDGEDLAVFEKRAQEPTVSYEDLLKKLKANGKI